PRHFSPPPPEMSVLFPSALAPPAPIRSASVARPADSSQPRPPDGLVSLVHAKNDPMMATNMIAAPPIHMTAPPMCKSSTGDGPQERGSIGLNGNELSEPSTTPVNASTGMAMNSRKSRSGYDTIHLIRSTPTSGRKER